MESGATLYLVYDGHGSTRALANSTGALVQRYLYDAYGNMMPGSGLTADPAAAFTSLLYSGEQTDRTGLQYLRARYYDPTNGRFASLDPFAGNAQDPQSLHKYLYTHANPVMGVDPSGHFTQEFGYAAHAAIQMDHRIAFPFPTEVQYGQWAGLQGAMRAMPDILNITDYEYNEIKPLSPSGIIAGTAQMVLRERQFGPLGFVADSDWPGVPRVTVAGTVPIMYFNIAGVIFYTDAIDLIEDVVALRVLNLGYQAAWQLLAQRANTLVNAFGRIHQLATASRSVDGARLQGDFSISALIASLGVI